MPEMLRVVAAAIRDDEGKVWSLPAPARHYQVIRFMRESGYMGGVNGPDQHGFIE